MCETQKQFLTRMNIIWDCYLHFVRHYGDFLPGVFDPLPFLDLPKVCIVYCATNRGSTFSVLILRPWVLEQPKQAFSQILKQAVQKACFPIKLWEIKWIFLVFLPTMGIHRTAGHPSGYNVEPKPGSTVPLFGSQPTELTVLFSVWWN